MTPLHVAVSLCPVNYVDIITALLENGADPNANFDKTGVVPILAAAQNHEGLEALLRCAENSLDMEKLNHLTGATPLAGQCHPRRLISL